MKFTLATAAHEPQLRRLARAEAMPGWIRLAFTREPNWFLGEQILGHAVQTIVAEDTDGTVAGCGVRAIRRAYINGNAANIGYLCGLRSLPAVRGTGILPRAYRALRQFHDADRATTGLAPVGREEQQFENHRSKIEHSCPAYLTTIVEDNTAAAALLTSGRAGLPAYLDRGRFITSAIPPGRRRPEPPPAGLTIRTGAEVPLDDILGFLNREGRKRQFFPVLDRAEFASPRLRGFDPADFRIALNGGAIVGVTATWDQRAFRQTLVAGYAPWVRWTRPLLNAGLWLAGRRALPPPGECLNFFHTAFTCIRGDDPEIFAALLERIHADHRGSPHHHFIVGLHERDPLRAALRHFPVFNYASRLYLACWKDGRPFCDDLDANRIPHLETAML